MKLGNYFRRLRAPTILAVLILPFSPVRGESMRSTYRGFTIDESQVSNAPALEEIRNAMKQQIDMVFAVGLPAGIQNFFQRVPFILIPSDAVPRSSPGFYRREDRSVRVTPRVVAIGRRPVLLHELLHAYHDQRLPDGFKNRDILSYFDKGKAVGAYASKSHMMQNPAEFFACAATTYLFGVTAQEPFSRDRVKIGQPEFFAYLKRLFGADAGNYVGSLSGGNSE